MNQNKVEVFIPDMEENHELPYIFKIEDIELPKELQSQLDILYANLNENNSLTPRGNILSVAFAIIEHYLSKGFSFSDVYEYLEELKYKKLMKQTDNLGFNLYIRFDEEDYEKQEKLGEQGIYLGCQCGSPMRTIRDDYSDVSQYKCVKCGQITIHV